MVALTNLLFAQMSQMEPDLSWLAIVISADNLSGGFAASACCDGKASARGAGLMAAPWAATQPAE